MAEQSTVRFDSCGVDCVGYLYYPASTSEELPCVVLGHGFGGTQDTPSIQYVAEELAAAGFAALTFDYRNFGESGGTPRQLISLQGQQADIHAAIRCARSRDSIDSDRIALWGTSLGGGHVIAVAADDPRIVAVVAQVPFNGFPKQVEGRSRTDTLRLFGAMAWDTIRGWLGRPPYYIPAVGTTDELAVMVSPRANQVINVMDSDQWQNEVTPRVLFEMMRFKPSDEAAQLAIPVLVCIAESDRETPAELARQIAENAPRGELRSYPVTHFEIYQPAVRTQIVEDQIDFLRKHLVSN